MPTTVKNCAGGKCRYTWKPRFSNSDCMWMNGCEAPSVEQATSIVEKDEGAAQLRRSLSALVLVEVLEAPVVEKQLVGALLEADELEAPAAPVVD